MNPLAAGSRATHRTRAEAVPPRPHPAQPHDDDDADGSDADAGADLCAAERPVAEALTSHGVPVDKGDVVVNHGSAGEIILSAAAFEPDALTRKSRHTGYTNDTVEADFIAFGQQSRLPLFIVACGDLAITLAIVAAGIPFEVLPMQLKCLVDVVVIVIGVLVSDTFARYAHESCRVVHPLTRMRRARIHEVSVAVLILNMVVGLTVNEITNTRAIFCPGYNATEKVGAFPKLADFPPGGRCIATSVGEPAETVLLCLFVPGRLRVQGIAVVVAAAAVVFLQTVNIFGDKYSGFYNVTGGEMLRRALDAAVHLISALAILAVAERRARDHFDAVATAAAVVRQRRATVLQLRALRRQLAVAGATEHQPPAAQRPTDEATTDSETTSRAPLSLLSHSAVEMGPVRILAPFLGERAATVFYGAFEGTDRLPLDDAAALAAHYDALQALIVLGDAPPTVRVWIVGDAIAAVSELCPVAALATMGDTFPDGALERGAFQVCDVASRVGGGVNTLATSLHTEWHAARMVFRGGVAAGRVSASLGADLRLETCSAPFRTAMRLARAPRHPSGTVLVEAATMELAAATFTRTAECVADGIPSFVLGHCAAVLLASAAADDVPWPTTLQSACDAIAASPLLCVAPEAELSQQRLDARLAVASWCCAQNDGTTGEGSVAGVCKGVVPRFEDPETEAEYQAHDDQRAPAQYASLCAAFGSCVVAVLALVAVDPAQGSHRATSLGATCALAGVAAVASCTAAYRSPHAFGTIHRAVMPTALVLCAGAIIVVASTPHLTLVSATVFTLLGNLILQFGLVLPEQPYVRFPIIVLVHVAALALTVILPNYGWPPGHRHFTEMTPYGTLAATAAAVVYARRHRTQFNDVHYLAVTREDLADSRRHMRDTLERYVPRAVVDALAATPADPLCRALLESDCTVVVVDLAQLMDAASASSEALSGVLGFADELRWRAAPGFVFMAGDAVIIVQPAAATALDRDDVDTSSTSAAALPTSAHMQSLVSAAVSNALRLPAFAGTSHAGVRAGMHRGLLANGLMGARCCSYAAAGPALDGARRLAEHPAASGALLVSADADWRLVEALRLPGVGAVAVVPLLRE